MLCSPISAAEWGKPLGAVYDGPEGKPRPVTPSPIELSADERSKEIVQLPLPLKSRLKQEPAD